MPTTSTVLTSPTAVMPPQSTDSPVELEGWVRLWENPGGIPSADLSWVKSDGERGLFTPIQEYRDNAGALKWPSVGVWRFSISVMYPSWYTMLTEVLCCGQCTKAARSGEGGKMGRWLAWDSAIMCQLSEAHQAMFPAILTDKHTFEAPPPPRELPSARVLRHAFLLAEANNVQDYRSQILSTFGTVLKMNSTKKLAPGAVTPKPSAVLPSPSAVMPTASTVLTSPTAVMPHQSTASPVELEGWVRLWENPGGIPSVDLSCVKSDGERGLFTPIQEYRDNTSALKRPAGTEVRPDVVSLYGTSRLH
ncbi:hypothetical protein PGIGA_G00237150 [Pangasianodon gigas]|uniref:Uncharacterized protein n=1 Tax=Pangasianodon gigas TaxID=30993 RepID=A0ACC5WM74_PANGG|nr:hypothetical protein [Pangasianodon gigas]